ncbi:MAG: hypothetical protein LUQ66_05650 [Methanoregula sp.]|nr:hypothetical protein [Methanoregula sp.]
MSLSLTPIWRRRLIGAFLTWLVPFVIAIPFYGPNGLLIDQQLFKSLMIVVGSITAAILIVWCFRPIETSYTREAIITGITWLLANWILDLIVLVGLLGMTMPDYATQIGLRYLVIPAMVIAVGIVADDVVTKN